MAFLEGDQKPRTSDAPDLSDIPEQLALETKYGTRIVIRVDEVIVESQLTETGCLVYSRKWKYPQFESQS